MAIRILSCIVIRYRMKLIQWNFLRHPRHDPVSHEIDPVKFRQASTSWSGIAWNWSSEISSDIHIMIRYRMKLILWNFVRHPHHDPVSHEIDPVKFPLTSTSWSGIAWNWSCEISSDIHIMIRYRMKLIQWNFVRHPRHDPVSHEIDPVKFPPTSTSWSGIAWNWSSEISSDIHIMIRYRMKLIQWNFVRHPRHDPVSHEIDPVKFPPTSTSWSGIAWNWSSEISSDIHIMIRYRMKLIQWNFLRHPHHDPVSHEIDPVKFPPTSTSWSGIAWNWSCEISFDIQICGFSHLLTVHYPTKLLCILVGFRVFFIDDLFNSKLVDTIWNAQLSV